MSRHYLIVDEAEERTINIFPYPTGTKVPIFNRAAVIAKVTLYSTISEHFIEHCLFHGPFLSEGVVKNGPQLETKYLSIKEITNSKLLQQPQGVKAWFSFACLGTAQMDVPRLP